MTKLTNLHPTPSTALGSVTQATICQFEHDIHDPKRLYTRLAAQNQELALWLRKRANELAPELEDREPVATLALELAGIIANQQVVDSLTRLAKA